MKPPGLLWTKRCFSHPQYISSLSVIVTYYKQVMYIVTPVMYFVSCVTINCVVEVEKTN